MGAVGMMDDGSCVLCALKHVSSAYVLWTESIQDDDYRFERCLALGELHCAELHLLFRHRELADLAREVRLAIEDGADIDKEFKSLVMSVDELTRQPVDTPEKEGK